MDAESPRVLVSGSARSVCKHVNPFSASVEESIVILCEDVTGRNNLRYENIHPLSDSASHAVAETNTSGVGHSRGTVFGGERRMNEDLLRARFCFTKGYVLSVWHEFLASWWNMLECRNRRDVFDFSFPIIPFFIPRPQRWQTLLRTSSLTTFSPSMP